MEPLMQIPVLFLKAHVDGFTRADGVTVQAHETKVHAAAPAFASHADARRKIAESGAGKTGSYVQHDDDIGLSSTSKTTATHDEAKAHAATHQKHLESMGFKKKSEETSNHGSAEFTTSYYKHPSGALANVSHSNGMQRIKGKKIPGASMEIHSNVKNDEKKEWKSGAKPTAAPAAAKKSTEALDPHPNVIGKAENVSKHSFDFGGKSYRATGKEGHSFHDSTPVAEHESEDGDRVWKDGTGRVHADSREDAKKYRGGK